MNTAIDRPKIHLIQDEILRLLEIHNMPMTARYLDALCELHEDIVQIDKALSNLSRLGLIEVAGTTDGRRGSIARLYRLAPKIEADEADEPSEAERLIDHLERDLAHGYAEEAIASADLASGPIGSRLMPATSASGSHAGDEFRSGPIADLSYDPDAAAYCRPAPAQARSVDPVIAAIERLSEPRWIDGRLNAARLRALAEQPAIAAQIDVAAWLNEMASTFEANA